ncbi:MAG: HEXXH motif-containing putative peptide modification protein [Bacteriovoracaceae bacterium]
MIFSAVQYARLKSRLKKKYLSDLETQIKKLKSDRDSKISFWLKELKSQLKIYSSINWFFLQQVKSYSQFKESLPKLSKDSSFSNYDDAVFEMWNKSEFANTFLTALNKGKSIFNASQIALKEMDEHLCVLGNRQILKEIDFSKSYRPQTSLGEVVKKNKISNLLATTLHLDGKDLILMTSSIKEMKTFSQRIDIALKIIKKFSPESWTQFHAFTDVIIPIAQKEFVSYSHQELPGYSMINMYDRDFVDLLDDLLHENGHHHLNHYLNLEKLIDEPVDAIYYSPWRRTLRPLRGIYHAYFTFFWAFKLFSDLASKKEIDSIWYLFSSSEKEKIIWRALEEYWMLNYTYEDLKWAKKQGLISTKGWNIIEAQNKELKKAKKKIATWEMALKHHRKDLKDLKKVLKDARNAYLKL